MNETKIRLACDGIWDEAMKVIEECSEITHAICKVYRFGWNSWHPDTPEINNYQQVRDELNDVQQSISILKLSLEKMSKQEASYTVNLSATQTLLSLSEIERKKGYRKG
jgi:hypothetical protein